MYNTDYESRFSTVVKTEVLSVFMKKIYLWMSGGLALTAITAWWVAGSPSAIQAIFGSSLYILLIVAELALVVIMSWMAPKLSQQAMMACFVVYSILNGVTLSAIFLIYHLGSVASVFFITAGTFAATSLYGYITKKDLTSVGSFMFMGLIGIVIASIVNMFLRSESMSYVISIIGVIVFVGLTAYDTQRLKNLAATAQEQGASVMGRWVILGALTLYLNFINLFLMLLRLLGSRR